MSATTPFPEPTSDDEEKKPFDPHDFPRDLRDAQREAAELYAELHALQKRLPWSREPHEGWPEVKERGQAGREPSPGWKPYEAAAYDQLWERLRERTAAVTAHGWWKTCKEQGIQGPDLVTARQKLKSAKGAVPLVREDIEAAA
ncbi:hypothetical protein [Streptomyces sp. NPDC048584]|uniref:hypothetical protein n=1 Tax=Streptomyces sp. NPDC048584 TaxID=3365573 RepID=UPI0037182040